jgi:outer membrane biosynthesis protein TonB
VLLAALALPAAAAVVVVQHRHAVSDGLPPAARAHGTVDVAAERTSDVRRPQPPSAAPSADAPMASDPMPESGTLPDPDEDLAAPASGARTSERMARPSAPDEPSRTIGSVGALARGGDDEGEADDIGSEGGVVGGVVGGLVGERLVPPAPSEAGPKQLTARAGQSLLAIDPNVSPYKVDLPEEYVQRGEEYHATISICVAADGSVSSVEILKPSIPIIDRQIPKVVPLWKYHPYLVDGKPTPFCYGTNYRVVRGP